MCLELLDRGIVAPIDEAEIFHVNGKPVLNGAFAVPKKGTPLEGETRITRLIMNLVPSNSFQRLMQGDLSTLSGSSAWCSLILKPNQILLWSGDDQHGAFYAWRLPEAWRSMMTFKWPLPGHLVNGKQPWVFVAASVIPMEWLNAVSLFQHLHRQLGLLSPPEGAGHEAWLEWRRDKPVPLPSNAGPRFTFVQYYLDDFDAPEIIAKAGNCCVGSWGLITNDNELLINIGV